MTTRVKIFSAGIEQFKLWRTELGKSEQEMADLAGITVEQYRAAEGSAEAAGKVYGQLVAAFRKIGKEPVTVVRGHSTLN